MDNRDAEKNVNKKRIIIVNVGNVMYFPPVINLIRCLIENNHEVMLISENIELLPSAILKSQLFKGINVKNNRPKGLISKIIHRHFRRKAYIDALLSNNIQETVVWTTTVGTCSFIGKPLLKCNHVMQLMELENKVPLYNGSKLLKFNIKKYAKNAKRIVVPEENRAYIEKIFWQLDNLPLILPNKPYSLEYFEQANEEFQNALEKIKNETSKVILYLGVFGFDRDLEPYAKAMRKLGGEYKLYLIGRIHSFGNTFSENKRNFEKLLHDYKEIEYLGFFNAPQHLAFVKYAYIGILPYHIDYKKQLAYQLNALYCAPNKIYEYAGFGIPMIGTNVLGIKIPFERYDIGVCCEEEDEESIIRAIDYVSERYSEMSKNCYKFYDSVNLGEIVEDILEW